MDIGRTLTWDGSAQRLVAVAWEMLSCSVPLLGAGARSAVDAMRDAMARGFESKSVADQQDLASGRLRARVGIGDPGCW